MIVQPDLMGERLMHARAGRIYRGVLHDFRATMFGARAGCRRMGSFWSWVLMGLRAIVARDPELSKILMRAFHFAAIASW